MRMAAARKSCPSCRVLAVTLRSVRSWKRCASELRLGMSLRWIPAGAEEGRKLFARCRCRQGVGVGLGHGRVLRVAAVGVPAGEGRGQAEVLPPAGTEPARAVGPAEPGDADTVAYGETGGAGAQRLD